MNKHESGFIAVGIGELLWDEFETGRRIGGAPANFAYHCQVLGAESYVVSAIGDDTSGRSILQNLDRLGLATTYVAISDGHATGSVTVALDGNGIPAYTIHEHVAWDFMPQASGQSALASRADVVCFGSLAQRSPIAKSTIRSFLKSTRPECIRLFDVNLRQAYYDRDIIEEGLEIANVLKLNESELAVLTNLLGVSDDRNRVLDYLATAYSIQTIALTRGGNGCLIRTEDETTEHFGFTQDSALDTVGAGDCFSAVLAMGLLNNDPIEQIAERANRLASYVCSQPGAMPEMPAHVLAQ